VIGPQVGSARSDSTRIVKVNRRKTNRRKTRPDCLCKWFHGSSYRCELNVWNEKMFIIETYHKYSGRKLASLNCVSEGTLFCKMNVPQHFL
jgi:hypothetical protein